MKSLLDLGAQQHAILEILWREEGATVRRVWERLSSGRALAYTSILSALQKLEAMGWVDHRREGRSYRYRARVSRDQARRTALARFRQRVYGDDAVALMRHAALGHDVDAAPDMASQPTLKSMVERRQAVARGPDPGWPQ